MNYEPQITFTELLRGRKFEDARVAKRVPGPVLLPKSPPQSATGCALAKLSGSKSGIPCRHHINALNPKKRAS